MAPSVGVPPAIPPSAIPHAIHSAHTVAPNTSKPNQTRRNRIQLSCTHCRHAKLKCDREKPCLQCVKKGRASLCTFPAPVARKRPAVSMQNRLKHLESLVKGVMMGPGPHVPGDPSSSSQATTSPAFVPRSQGSIEAEGAFDGASISTKDYLSNSGQVLLGPNESTYVGATHWAAILDDVSRIVALD